MKNSGLRAGACGKMGNKHFTTWKLQAFTLVEVVAITGIVLVLIALLFPAVRSAYDVGLRSACLGNLRNYGTTMLAYANENNGLPRYTSAGSPDFGATFTNYTKRPLPRCPLKGKETKSFYYTCNLNLAAYYPTLIGLPVSPSRVVFAAERNYASGFSSYSHFNMTIWANNGGEVGNEGSASTNNYSSKPQYHGSRDKRGLNFMMLDGHCEFLIPSGNNWALPPVYGPTDTSQAATNSGYFYHTLQFENMADGSLSTQ